MNFKLYKPVKLASGDTIESLELVFDSLCLVDIKNARKVKSMVSTVNAMQNESVSPRLDSDLRIGLAWVAAMKSDNRISINDAVNLSPKDAFMLSEEVLSSYLF